MCCTICWPLGKKYVWPILCHLKTMRQFSTFRQYGCRSRSGALERCMSRTQNSRILKRIQRHRVKCQQTGRDITQRVMSMRIRRNERRLMSRLKLLRQQRYYCHSLSKVKLTFGNSSTDGLLARKVPGKPQHVKSSKFASVPSALQTAWTCMLQGYTGIYLQRMDGE